MNPIVLQHASIFYGDVIGLSKVDLEVESGITGIVGPNGCGKSTLMRTLCGLIEPDEGTVRVLGGSPFTDEKIRARTGFVPATECFYEGLSGQRNLEVAFMSHGRSRSDSKDLGSRALETVGLSEHGHRAYGTWSRGMRQRLKLGLTLVSDTEVVLLDEPFLGVDPPSRRHLRDLIQQLGASGRTVLVSSHVLHEIEALTDRVGVLAHGRLLGFGRVEELLLDLRDQHPHRIRFSVDEPRLLAKALVGRDHIQQVLVGTDSIEVVTGRPEIAYREIPTVMREARVVIREVRTLDNSLEAVFQHVTEAGAKRL